MKLRSRALVFLLSFLASFAAWGVPAASVDAVQLPAWRVRGEVSEPLAPGMELQNGDQVRTGSGARVYLKLAEGSTVKLGESARMSFYSRSLKPASFFRGAIDVAVGAFRYTTAQAAKLRQRDVAIRVGTTTIGIRRTDVWGKSDDGQDLVMLIEGRIEVKLAGGEPVEISDPLSVFVAPKGAAPLPLSTATEAELKSRSRETDLESSNGALHLSGRYALRLGDALDEASALGLYDQARIAGYPARIRPRRSESGWQYEVLVKGYASESEARRAAGPVGTALKVTATAVR
ncbi:MAG TPA: FecR domain-containing protein [Rhodocyclaceae bacterium]|nr:FecR domain-containing protein [Rhodocyclaceae bacterium]